MYLLKDIAFLFSLYGNGYREITQIDYLNSLQVENCEEQAVIWLQKKV
jgi:hypothetical protein